MQICEQKLDKYNIPKKYLTNKKFSYKLYLNLCSIAFWKYDENNEGNRFIEYRLFNYNLKQMSKLFHMSVNTIKNRISKKPYRDKFDIYETDEDNTLLSQYTYTRTKHLMFNSPIREYVVISLKELNSIKDLDEMSIRFYILLNGMGNKEIYNLNQKDILDKIGYSGNSTNNKKKLSKITKELEKLGLIKIDVSYNNSMKYLSYKII